MPAKRLSLESQYSILGVLLIAPTVLVFSAVIVYPLLSAIYLSLYSIYTPTLQGEWVGLANYQRLLAKGEFWISLRNTLVWTVGTLALQIVFGVAMALVLNRSLLFRPLARSLVLFPYFVSTVVAVLVWRWVFNDLYGILNHTLMRMGILDMPLDWLGSMPNAMLSIILVGAWKYFPFVVIAVLARLQSIPDALYEAAEIDGASLARQFWHITLPQLRGVITTIVLLDSIWTFRAFDPVFVMTGGGPAHASEVLPTVIYFDGFQKLDFGYASAQAVVMFVVLFVVSAFYMRRSMSTAG
ncbi:MAG: sugar ABC transporter permease [Geminicoccaceae bacterium]